MTGMHGNVLHEHMETLHREHTSPVNPKLIFQNSKLQQAGYSIYLATLLIYGRIEGLSNTHVNLASLSHFGLTKVFLRLK